MTPTWNMLMKVSNPITVVMLLTTLLVVAGLYKPEMKIEIEVTALRRGT